MGYKVRWTAEGKPKELIGQNYDDALTRKIAKGTQNKLNKH
jgi:hypothetical protein